MKKVTRLIKAEADVWSRCCARHGILHQNCRYLVFVCFKWHAGTLPLCIWNSARGAAIEPAIVRLPGRWFAAALPWIRLSGVNQAWDNAVFPVLPYFPFFKNYQLLYASTKPQLVMDNCAGCISWNKVAQFVREWVVTRVTKRITGHHPKMSIKSLHWWTPPECSVRILQLKTMQANRGDWGIPSKWITQNDWVQTFSRIF